jgi:hypothetical protein
VTRSARAFALACGMLAFLAATRVQSEEPIKPDQFVAQFERLHGLVKPTLEEETWAQVPWLASLWEARQRAATEGKPILLWEMDGNPLGCT